MKKWYLERNAPTAGTWLCKVDDICTSEVAEFKFGENIKTLFRMFIFNDQGQLRAYMNVCPHFNVPLNVTPGEFFTSDRAQFMCSIHYAKFNVGNGECTDGPCEGMALEVIPLSVIDSEVYIGNSMKA